MASKNIFLTERGFGTSKHGEAVIIAGPNGEPVTLRTVITPNKSIGGQLTIVPLKERDVKRSTSDINDKEVIYELKINRNTAAMSGGTIRVKKIDAINMEIQMFEIGFSCSKSGETQFIESMEMENSEMAKSLLSGILFNAFSAGLDRAEQYRPDRLYYGMQATDVAPIQKKWYNKATGQEQDERPNNRAFQEVLA